MVMTSELSGVPEHDVLCIEETRDPQRAAVFAFARKVSREPAAITSEDVDSLRPYLKDAQIVELVFAVCRYNTMNRLADAFGVPLEKDNVFAPPAKKKKKEGGAGGTPKPKETAAGKKDFMDRYVEFLLKTGGPGLVVETAVEDRVSLSIGDGHAEVGDVLQLVRAETEHVGQIVITSVKGKRAEGLFDTTGPRAAGFPRKGDRAFHSGALESGALKTRVNAVKEDLVSISAGARDKIRMDDAFHISRKWGRYVGRIRITQIDENLSVGVLEELGKAAPPQVGDDVTPAE
ncbi:MAG: carboxymuconolactone decarboxylase family protein [Planctomycetota bacterium]